MSALRYRAQFWAPARGRVDVWFRVVAQADPGGLAGAIVHEARKSFEAKWPGLGRDRIHLVGIEDSKTGRRWGETYSKPRGGVADL